MPSFGAILRASLRLPVPPVRLSLHALRRGRSQVPPDARMSWGYRRSRKLARGVRLNVGKRGLGVSLGPRGAKVSVNTRGQRSLFLSLFGFFSRKRL
jgi:hypothetical protein